MTAAAWVLTWRGALAAYGIASAIFTIGWAVACTPGRRQERAAEQRDAARRNAASYDELAQRRQATSWFQSQAYFDAECECIEIAERIRSRSRHPTARKPNP
jgi:hypothetical protein